MSCAAFCKHAIELIEVRIKVKDWGDQRSDSMTVAKSASLTINRDPFHDIGIFGLHDNCFKVSLHKRSLNEGTAEKQRLLRWLRARRAWGNL